MTDVSPPSDIDSIRREIDAIDRALLTQIAQRLQLAERLGATKADAAGPPIRPGREIALLRSLIAAAPQSLDRELVVEIWRALISASLRRQRIVDVVVAGGRTDPTRMFDIARRHFGARTRISNVGDPQEALRRAAEKPESCVAVTPWPGAPGVGAWWPALSESRFHKLHLIAGLPVAGSGDEPEAAVFSAAASEEAGGDVTLLLAEDPHHRLQRALSEAGLVGREISRSEPRVMVRIDGFLAIDDARASKITGAGLERVRVLGSYARV